MARRWFDAATGLLTLDDEIASRESFQRAMADGMVTTDELAEEAQRVASSLRALEATLTSEQHELATEALCELAVLHALFMRFGTAS